MSVVTVLDFFGKIHFVGSYTDVQIWLKDKDQNNYWTREEDS
jgi:hypothetical protein